ncbi:UNKNOWN [Stylonychia lemnae]|uniref:Uncharacterized protein n=1 Tax=Stylonychia lemnae TaxID=5949 RepID=A0A077ZXZ0_STYLE|nr:UNKNOWN [Stylonychia lemnae]|eukprot:CDW74776.1 UNKNOWN [Stylonychia lemnae]
MKKYITIAGAALLGHVSAQENLAAAELSVESPNPQVIYYGGYVDPLYDTQHQLKEQAYLQTLQKIYGTSVQSPQVQADNDVDPLADVMRESKQAAYLRMLQNIQDGPVPVGPNPLGLTEYQLREQAYLKAYQNIYGPSVQSPQWGYYDPLYQPEHQLKEQAYLQTLQKIYGTNVQDPKVQQDPLSDVEREMKQATYLSGMQNIYGHYANVQSPQWGYYDPLYQPAHQLKEQAYLETMQKIYGTKVQEPKVEQVDPLADAERELKQAAYLAALQNIHGHYNVQSPNVEKGNPLLDSERTKMKISAYPGDMQNIYGHYANVQARHSKPKPANPLSSVEEQLKEQAYLEALQKIYGTSVQSGNPLSDVEREMKQATYLSGMQNIYGHYPLVESQKSTIDWSKVPRIHHQIECLVAPCPQVESPQYLIYGGAYDPLGQQKHQLKEQAYLETMQKIYGNKVQEPKVEAPQDPLADAERELKQAAYLEVLQNIHGHYTPLVQDYKDRSEMRSTRRHGNDWDDEE